MFSAHNRCCSFLHSDAVQDLTTTAQQHRDVRAALSVVPADEADKFSACTVRVSEPDRVESMWRRFKDILLREAETKNLSVDPSASAFDIASALYK